METKLAENEEMEIEETEEPKSSLDFDEPQIVDWDAELGEVEEIEEDHDITDVIEAANSEDDAIFESAKAYGIDDESLKEFQSDPQALKKALDLFERQGVKPKTTEETDAEIPVGDTYKSTIDDKTWDTDIVEQFKALEKVSEGLYARIQSLESQLNVSSQDELFSRVDDKFSDLLGQGPSSLLSDGEQVANRNKVVEQIDLLKAGYKKLGKDVPSPDKLLNQAVKTTFADQIEGLAEKKISSKMAKRQNQKTARPTKRTGRKLDPRKEAEKSVAKLMRERGMLGSISETFE
tara:strand:- start:1882 stop:2757 length:876 start_codon:yes stop_codon:yes gene_type:complete